MVTWFGTVGMMWMWRHDWCNCSYLSPELSPSRYTWHGLQSSFYPAPSSYGYSLSLSLYLSLSVRFLFFFSMGRLFLLWVYVINAYWLVRGDFSLSLSLSLYIYIYIYIYIYRSLSVCYFFLF
ncbi:hypothetical protein AMTRI_Chr10g227710 [Amborella trichopoda]